MTRGTLAPGTSLRTRSHTTSRLYGRALTLRESDNVNIPHPHPGLLHRLPNDTHNPFAVVPRGVGGQEPLARWSDVRVPHVAEDRHKRRAGRGGLVRDDAGAELVRGPFDAECEEAAFWCVSECMRTTGGKGGER